MGDFLEQFVDTVADVIEGFIDAIVHIL